MYPDQDSGVQDLNNNNRLDEWDDILNSTSLKDMQASEKARLVSERMCCFDDTDHSTSFRIADASPSIPNFNY